MTVICGPFGVNWCLPNIARIEPYNIAASVFFSIILINPKANPEVSRPEAFEVPNRRSDDTFGGTKVEHLFATYLSEVTSRAQTLVPKYRVSLKDARNTGELVRGVGLLQALWKLSIFGSS